MAKKVGKPGETAAADNAAMRALRAQQVNAAFAQIVMLMMRSQRFRNTFLAELEWLVAPAVATGQFLVSDVKSSPEGFPTPVAAVLWARVSEAVDARLMSSKTKPVLKPGEWASGKIPWLIESIGDPQAAGALIKKLAEGPFAKVGLKAVERQPDGQILVRMLGSPQAAKTPDKSKN